MTSTIQRLKDRAMHALAGDIEDRSAKELLDIRDELLAVAAGIDRVESDMHPIEPAPAGKE